MLKVTKAAILAVALAVPVAAFAQAAPAKKAAAPAKKTTVATHTTSGTVKSASDTQLVVTKGSKDETFTVNATTKKDGDIAAGAKVTVAYTMDGKDMVATSIKAAPAKAAKAAPKKK
jgi:Rieske Fe-S protein